jgi:hypothetical protein
MKNHIHNIAKYTALILISSIPMPFDASAETYKKQTAKLIPGVVKISSETNSKILADKQQKYDYDAE